MIIVANVYKYFDDKLVLKGINLTINRGETFLLIGRSGAGKTVLLKIITSLLLPDKGRVIIDGVNIFDLSKRERQKLRLNFGFVFQNGALFDFLNVEENVGFYFYQHTKLNREEIKRRVREALSMVGLEGVEKLYPYQLSGGMKKRVAIARAIVYNPKIIIYDEPTVGVDPISIDMIVNLIKGLHRRLNITSVIVTHDLKVGLSLADRLAFLLGGKIIFEGNKSELDNIDDPRLIQFMKGESAGPIREMEV